MATRKLTVPEFARLLGRTALTRKITAVHLHHTWRPRRRDFRGAASIEAMRRHHMEVNGWSDIAQHLTLDPEGCVWTGRDWNRAPASSSGFNGSPAAGPFMIEMVGDFDRGQDPFDGRQRESAIDVVARLLWQFDLAPDAIKFHRDLNSPKTCPGTAIDLTEFRSAVAAAFAQLSPRDRRTVAVSQARLSAAMPPVGEDERGEPATSPALTPHKPRARKKAAKSA